MRENMNDEDKEEFDQFVERVWGTKTPVRKKANITTNVTETEIIEPEIVVKKRGRKPKAEK